MSLFLGCIYYHDKIQVTIYFLDISYNYILDILEIFAKNLVVLI